MTLVEALRTGKRLRPCGGTFWLENPTAPYTNPGVMETFHYTLILGDWEVEPTSVFITREQFNSAWDKAFSGDASTIERHTIMCRELGL